MNRKSVRLSLGIAFLDCLPAALQPSTHAQAISLAYEAGYDPAALRLIDAANFEAHEPGAAQPARDQKREESTLNPRLSPLRKLAHETADTISSIYCCFTPDGSTLWIKLML